MDVNVLLSLFDLLHVHHSRAHAWWMTNKSTGWASCPLTQNGFVRVISKPGYERPIGLQTVLSALAAQVGQPDHEFWPHGPREVRRRQRRGGAGLGALSVIASQRVARMRAR